MSRHFILLGLIPTAAPGHQAYTIASPAASAAPATAPIPSTIPTPPTAPVDDDDEVFQQSYHQLPSKEQSFPAK